LIEQKIETQNENVILEESFSKLSTDLALKKDFSEMT